MSPDVQAGKTRQASQPQAGTTYLFKQHSIPIKPEIGCTALISRLLVAFITGSWVDQKARLLQTLPLWEAGPSGWAMGMSNTPLSALQTKRRPVGAAAKAPEYSRMLMPWNIGHAQSPEQKREISFIIASNKRNHDNDDDNSN